VQPKLRKLRPGIALKLVRNLPKRQSVAPTLS
jgi:hypothetical protein